MKYSIFLFLLMPMLAFGVSTDTGKVSKFYTNEAGYVAVQLNGGFPNANAANECNGNGGWAGTYNGDNMLKSTLLSASASGATISLVTSGCVGAWLKVNSIYVVQ